MAGGLALLCALLACSTQPSVPPPALLTPAPIAAHAPAPSPQLEAAAQALRGGDYLQARLLVAEAMAQQPSDQLRVVRALALVAQQSFDEAFAGVAEVLEHSPDDPGAAVALAHLALARREHGLALELLEPVVAGMGATLPPSAYGQLIREMALLGMGWACANQARHADAVGWFDQVLAHNPDHILALLGRGNALSGLRQLDAAEASFRRALALEPGNPYAMAELGLIHYNRGQDEQARASFEAALVVDPVRYTCPHEGLGLVYLRQGHTEQARAAFEQAIRINPDIEYKKYNGLARIFMDEGRLDEARALLEKSVQNYPYDDEARQLLAELGGPPSSP